MLYIYIVQEAKRRGDSISVETCPHYLAFSTKDSVEINYISEKQSSPYEPVL